MVKEIGSESTPDLQRITGVQDLDPHADTPRLTDLTPSSPSREPSVGQEPKR